MLLLDARTCKSRFRHEICIHELRRRPRIHQEYCWHPSNRPHHLDQLRLPRSYHTQLQHSSPSLVAWFFVSRRALSSSVPAGLLVFCVASPLLLLPLLPVHGFHYPFPSGQFALNVSFLLAPITYFFRERTSRLHVSFSPTSETSQRFAVPSSSTPVAAPRPAARGPPGAGVPFLHHCQHQLLHLLGLRGISPPLPIVFTASFPFFPATAPGTSNDPS